MIIHTYHMGTIRNSRDFVIFAWRYVFDTVGIEKLILCLIDINYSRLSKKYSVVRNLISRP